MAGRAGLLAEQERAPMRLRGEVRLKSDEQLEAQRRAIAAACGRRGWRLLEAGEETGLSAEELQRAGIAAALRLLALADGKTLVAAKRGRLSRSLRDLTGPLAAAQQQGLGACCARVRPRDDDAGRGAARDPARRLRPLRAAADLGADAAGARGQAPQGVRLGRPPTISQYVLDRIRRERAAGQSLTAIANGLNADRVPTAQGGRRWYPATIRYTLNRTR